MYFEYLNPTPFLEYYAGRASAILGDKYIVKGSKDGDALKIVTMEKDCVTDYDYSGDGRPKPIRGLGCGRSMYIKLIPLPGLCGGMFFYLTQGKIGSMTDKQGKLMHDLLFEMKEMVARAEKRNGLYYVTIGRQSAINNALKRNGWKAQGSFNNWNTNNACTMYLKEATGGEYDAPTMPGRGGFIKKDFEAWLPEVGYEVYKEGTAAKKTRKKPVRKGNI